MGYLDPQGLLYPPSQNNTAKLQDQPAKALGFGVQDLGFRVQGLAITPAPVLEDFPTPELCQPQLGLMSGAVISICPAHAPRRFGFVA